MAIQKQSIGASEDVELTQDEFTQDELTPYQLRQAAYYQSPEGRAKLDAKQKKDAQINALTQQILAQGITSKWKGEGKGSAEANARDMAQIMADIGITDIKQFGQITKTIPGSGDSYETEQGTVDVPEQTYTTYGNKATGQAVANTYSERQTGNAFGGTFSGEGNTGYRVQFDAQGNPIFYTTAASSNTLQGIMDDLGPIGNIALAVATGGLTLPQQIAANLAFQVLSGKDLESAIKGAAISLAVAQIPGTDIMTEASSFIKGLDLPVGVTNTVNNAVQNATISGAKAVLMGQDIGDAVINGAIAGGTNGAVTALLKDMDGFGALTGAQQKMVVNAVTGAISGKPLDQLVINAAIATANAEIADQKTYAPLSDEDYADLNDNQKSIYDAGGSKALTQFNRDLKNLSSLTTSGRTGDDLGGGYTDAEDILTTLQGAGLIETGLGDQDVLDYLNTSSVVGGGGNDVVAGGGGNDDTVLVTGAAGNDVITGAGGNDVVGGTTRGLTDLGTTTVTGAKGNDTVVITDKKCDPGFVYDEDLKMCVAITDTTNIVGGTGNDAITGAKGNDTVVITDKKCDPGTHYDEDLKMSLQNLDLFSARNFHTSRSRNQHFSKSLAHSVEERFRHAIGQQGKDRQSSI